jgi:excisionase family DNA binding protein
MSMKLSESLSVECEEWLKVDEARKILRLGRNRFYESIADGTIPSKRFGRAIRVHKSAIIPDNLRDPKGTT